MLFTRQILLGACSDVGSLEDSRRVFERMMSEGFSVNRRVYNLILQSTARSMEWRIAEDVFSRMVADGFKPNEFSYNSMIAAYSYGALGGAYADAEEAVAKGHGMMEQMLKSSIEPNVQTFTILIDMCVKSGEWKKAMQYWNLMLQRGIKPEAAQYYVIVEAVWDHEPDTGYWPFPPNFSTLCFLLVFPTLPVLSCGGQKLALGALLALLPMRNPRRSAAVPGFAEC